MPETPISLRLWAALTRLWTGLVALFRSGAGTVHAPVQLCFTTPARGDAFDFVVNVRGNWTACGRHRDGILDALIVERWTAGEELIRDTVRKHARYFPPHHPEEAEAMVNSALEAALPSVISEDEQPAGCRLSCQARASIGMSEPVRNVQQEAWTQLLRRDAGFELAKQLGKLREEWEKVLGRALADWKERYAVQLAERPTATSEVVGGMLDERRREAEKQLTALGRTIDDHDRLDILDFVVQTDGALRAIMKTLGVPLPDPVSGNPFTGLPES